MSNPETIYNVAAAQSKNNLFGAAIPPNVNPMIIKKIRQKRLIDVIKGAVTITLFVMILVGFLITLVYATQGTWNSVSIGTTIAVVFVGIAVGVMGIWYYDRRKSNEYRRSVQRCSINSITGWEQCSSLIFDLK